jgi:hypothetical protein
MNPLKEGPSFGIGYRAVWYQVKNVLQIVEMEKWSLCCFKDYLAVTHIDFVAVSSKIWN